MPLFIFFQDNKVAKQPETQNVFHGFYFFTAYQSTHVTLFWFLSRVLRGFCLLLSDQLKTEKCGLKCHGLFTFSPTRQASQFQFQFRIKRYQKCLFCFEEVANFYCEIAKIFPWYMKNFPGRFNAFNSVGNLTSRTRKMCSTRGVSEKYPDQIALKLCQIFLP